jgi:hypothetical protein
LVVVVVVVVVVGLELQLENNATTIRALTARMLEFVIGKPALE